MSQEVREKRKIWNRLFLGCFALFAGFAFLSISIAQMGFLLTVILYLIKSLLSADFKLSHTPLDLPFLCFAGAAVLSVSASVDPMFSLYQLLKFLPFIFVYFIFVTYLTKQNLNLLLVILLVSASLGCLWGLWEFAHGVTRIDGPADSTGTLANCLAIIISLALSLVLFTHSRIKKGIPKNRRFFGNKKKSWPLLLLVALFALTLLLTFTRSAILGLSASVLAIGLIKIGRNKKRLYGLALIIILFLAFSFYLVGKGRGESPVWINTMERVSIWKSGWHIILDHPFTGVGLGCVRKVYPQYKLPSDSLGNRFELHDSYLQTWAECGPLGLLSFLSLLFFFVLNAWRTFKNEKDEHLRAVIVGSLGGFLAMVVSGFFANSFGDGGVAMLILFLMGTTMAIRKWQKEGVLSNIL